MTAVLILNYNNVEDTQNCIESVKLYNTAEIRFYIVDNGSNRPHVVPLLEKFLRKLFKDDYTIINDGDIIQEYKQVIYIRSNNNDGYARGNNKGLKYIYQDEAIDNVLILNNDVLFVEDIIPSLIKNLNVLPRCGIISPILYHRDLKEIDYNCARLNHTRKDFLLLHLLLMQNFCGFKNKETRSRQILKTHPNFILSPYFEIEMPSGSCMLFKKDMFRKIGSFDPNTFLYYEENILHKKIQAENLKNYLIPSLKCIHLGGMSTQNSPSAFIKIKSLESALYYANNYVGFNRIQKIIFRCSINMAKFLIMLKNRK